MGDPRSSAAFSDRWPTRWSTITEVLSASSTLNRVSARSRAIRSRIGSAATARRLRRSTSDRTLSRTSWPGSSPNIAARRQASWISGRGRDGRSPPAAPASRTPSRLLCAS
jgi:hypothetical protein